MNALPERRLPVHLRSTSSEFSLESWLKSDKFNSQLYFEAIHGIREQIVKFVPGSEDDWTLIVQMLLALAAKDSGLEDYVFDGNATPQIDSNKWLLIAEAASWRAVKQYNSAVQTGSWSPS